MIKSTTFGSVGALISNTLQGMAAVTGVAFFFIPHWTATLFIVPMITILYIDMLGALQWAGVSINVVSYITLVMSIGLLVDFTMHVLVRYYETSGNRKERVVETMSTMGASVLSCGVSTFLGTMPLAFTSSEIFRIVFISFFSLVVLGVAHGLIVVPVILSFVGPENKSSKAVKSEEPVSDPTALSLSESSSSSCKSTPYRNKGTSSTESSSSSSSDEYESKHLTAVESAAGSTKSKTLAESAGQAARSRSNEEVVNDDDDDSDSSDIETFEDEETYPNAGITINKSSSSKISLTYQIASTDGGTEVVFT